MSRTLACLGERLRVFCLWVGLGIGAMCTMGAFGRIAICFLFDLEARKQPLHDKCFSLTFTTFLEFTSARSAMLAMSSCQMVAADPTSALQTKLMQVAKRASS